MKQFRDSKYWVGEDGKVFIYLEARKWVSPKPYKNNVTGKKYYNTRNLPRVWRKLKPQMKKGYEYFAPIIDKVRHNMSGHRMVAELYVPGYFEGAHVDHIDNNPLNNHYTNLQWCTQEYNNSKGDKLTFPLYSEWCKQQHFVPYPSQRLFQRGYIY